MRDCSMYREWGNLARRAGVIAALALFVPACSNTDSGNAQLGDAVVVTTTTTEPEAPTPAPAQEPEFAGAVGDWEAVDDFDGSNLTMTMEMTGDGRFTFTYHDDAATICGLDEKDEPQYALAAEAVGDVEGDTLTATGITATCDETGETHIVDWTYVYDPASDTLRERAQGDEFVDDVVWSRQ